MSNSDLSTKISTRLAQEIASGTLSPGGHIRTQEIADRYQVSRTPVRDALEALEKIGLLERFPNRGYFVVEDIPQASVEQAMAQSPEHDDEYQRLAEDWLKDRIPEIVTEQSLRQRYDLTKAKLNDILSRASREGWAERRDGYGWRLLPVAKTGEAFDQIYRFRMTIEPAAMLEPTFEIDRRVLGEQRRIQEGMLDLDVSSTPPERILNHGADFHEAIMQMSHNPFFITALERVNRMRRLMEYRTRVDKDRVVAQSTQHLQILELLEAGEIVEASYLMRRHLSGALKRKSPLARDWTSASAAE